METLNFCDKEPFWLPAMERQAFIRGELLSLNQEPSTLTPIGNV